MEGFKQPESGGMKRAAFELGCSENQLQFRELGESTVGVEGCGKKAVYVWATGAGWVNNSASEESKAGEKKQ
jgi:hypothetical protein